MSNWTEVKPREITSIFRGVTTPIPELTRQIEWQGWEVAGISQSSDGHVAKAKSPHGDKLERTGIDPNTALANLLIAITRRNYMRIKSKVSQWQDMSHWHDVATVAKAYAEAPIYDPKAVGGFKELADDSVRRMAILQQQIEVEIVDDPEPYHSPQEMCQDIHEKQHFFVSRANCDHPVWTTDQNVAFRTVHDVLGHCVAGGSFDFGGELRACAAHFPLLTTEAQKALATECIGQTAYAALYRGFGPQKVAYLDDFIDQAQADNNSSAHQGIHPSQSLAPVQSPAIPDPDYEKYGLPKGNIAPHQEALGLTPVLTKVAAGQVIDPNHAYQTGIEPHPDYHAQLHYGDPLEHDAVKDTASKIDTGWSQKDESDAGQRAIMKQAIVNAFRVVLLSPRKDLRWNCHDKETEALTDRGWLSAQELRNLWNNQEPFRVATYINGELHFEFPLEMPWQTYQGEMYRYQGRYVDALVTPNHRMLTVDGLVEASRLPISLGVGRDSKGRGYGPYMPTIGEVNNRDCDRFIIEGAKKREPVLVGRVAASHTNHSDLELRMDDWLDWLGWYISEGWLDGRNHPWLCQKEDCSDMIRRSSKIIWGEEGFVKLDGMWVAKVPRYAAKSVGQWIASNVGKGARNKRLPNFVFDLSVRQMKILLNAMISGDGTRLNEQNWVYYTASKQLANDIHRLTTLAGYRSIIGPTAKNQWVVRINAGDKTRIPHHDLVQYDGQIWCFTTPSGTLVTRRNGKTLISGNSAHYQDISHVPAEVDDPKIYWDALEAKRRSHNEARGRHPDAHLVYFKPRQRYYQMVQMMNPTITHDQAIAKADEAIWKMRTLEEERLEAEEEKKSPEKKRSNDEIERRVNEAIAKQLKSITDEAFNEKSDVPHQEHEQLGFAAKVADIEQSGEVNHRVAWEPGNCGKGILFRNGEVHTWSTRMNRGFGDEYAKEDGWPFHVDYIMSELGNAPPAKPEQFFHIGKDGQVTASPNFMPYIKGADPRLKPYNKDEWRFGAKGQRDIFTGEDAEFYGAFMGTHLKSIAQISRHSEELLESALQDVQEHDGTGHYFRAKTLQLGVPGVGPKVASFAWLLLQPMTSQLATIDTHMMDVLGHNYEKEMNNRDYFKFERELQAGRDASGYGHVPLGQFQWGMWDHKRTGPGSHQDHSAMRVLGPVPHADIDWAGKAQNLKGESWHSQAPEWWQATQEPRQQVADHWDNTIGKSVPQGAIPFQTVAISKTATEPGEFGAHNFQYWTRDPNLEAHEAYPHPNFDVEGLEERLRQIRAARK